MKMKTAMLAFVLVCVAGAASVAADAPLSATEKQKVRDALKALPKSVVARGTPGIVAYLNAGDLVTPPVFTNRLVIRNIPVTSTNKTTGLLDQKFVTVTNVAKVLVKPAVVKRRCEVRVKGKDIEDVQRERVR